VNTFFAGIGADQLTDEYDLDATPHPAAAPIASSQSAVIVGCAGVAAMTDPQYQAFVQEAYDQLKTLRLTARSTYYQLSWTAMTLAFMTGSIRT
jgi:hypothetical protein